MNKNYLYKALCLLTVLTVQQADASLLMNPIGPSYQVDDNCYSCSGFTWLDINVLENNTPIVLDFDTMGNPQESFDLYLVNGTSAGWTSLTIEYLSQDPWAPVTVGLNLLDSGTSTPSLTSVLHNPNTANISGMEVSFLPLEQQWLHIDGFAGTWDVPFSLVIQTSAVPIPAAVWLFGSGLIGLIGVARRKKA